MRNKAPLALMEQLVMILVFALAAALCMQVFVLSDRMSRRSEDRDHALLQAQNAIETLKSCQGDYAEASRLLEGEWNNQILELHYDRDWQKTGEATYYLQISPTDHSQPLLGTANVNVYTKDGDLLCCLPASWQEVDKRG